MIFKVVKTRLGATSIQNLEIGEILHNPLGPWAEANDLYVAQSRLEAKLKEPSSEPLVIYDVGLGAAANSLAAIDLYFRLSPAHRRPLTVISFENDLRMAHFALEQAREFAHIEKWKDAMAGLLAHHKYEKYGLVWRLHESEFLDAMKGEPQVPDLIFFDLYSPKSNPGGWTLGAFQALFSKCRPDTKKTMLLTYTRSTAARAGLLLAGFYVGTGQSAFDDLETTHAATHLDELQTPLDARWFQRWSRSDTPFPAGVESSTFEQHRKKIQLHPQFRHLSHP